MFRSLGIHRSLPVSTLAAGALVLLALLAAAPAHANHSVFVEGDADFDGDGLLGTEEDTDGDLVFGTLNGGLNGIGGNGSVTVVTSGQFNESLKIIDPGGNVVIQSAPGVIAVIEAFRPPGSDPANTTRQNMAAIEVSQPSAGAGALAIDARVHEGTDDGQRVVVLRNLHIRNWRVGVTAGGNAIVTIDNCLFDSNTAYGIELTGFSRVTVSNSIVSSTGRRTTPSPGLMAATPGVGIAAKERSTIDIFNTVVSGSTGAGIANITDDAAPFRVRVNDVIVRDNKPGLDTLNFYPARFDRATQTQVQ